MYSSTIFSCFVSKSENYILAFYLTLSLLLCMVVYDRENEMMMMILSRPANIMQLMMITKLLCKLKEFFLLCSMSYSMFIS
mmetsp:Transcript_2407/g.3856  ORF Transcript_2407/g.3856 Transcript_2407/m.3856 type:complete len:81 (-) Transcript_2407:66-308(-)